MSRSTPEAAGSRRRLDIELEVRGLLPSRARARDAVLRGTVTVNGLAVSKPSLLVSADDSIQLDDPAAEYVSRAALKLVAGLEAAGLAVAGKVCLDVGASTGGFTQVLLKRGAARLRPGCGARPVARDAARPPRRVGPRRPQCPRRHRH